MIKKIIANEKTVIVINEQDTVDSPAYAVFCDVRQIAGVSLPHVSKRIFLKSFFVLRVGMHMAGTSDTTERTGL